MRLASTSEMDQRGGRYKILGSCGHSIILNNAFKEYLLKRGLIQEAWHKMTYRFLPAPPEILAELGIRYFMSNNLQEFLLKWGWVLRGTEGGVTLYENPYKPTPCYFVSENHIVGFVSDYLLLSNEIVVNIPKDRAGKDLECTFLAHKGWKAFLNGVRIPITMAHVPFFVKISPATSGELHLIYEPYSDRYILGSVFLSSIIFVGSMVFGRRLLSGKGTFRVLHKWKSPHFYYRQR